MMRRKPGASAVQVDVACLLRRARLGDRGRPGDDVRPLVHQVMDGSGAIHSGRGARLGRHPYDSDPAGTAVQPLARPFTEQDCAARGDRAWLAGSLALSTPQARAA